MWLLPVMHWASQCWAPSQSRHGPPLYSLPPPPTWGFALQPPSQPLPPPLQTWNLTIEGAPALTSGGYWSMYDRYKRVVRTLLDAFLFLWRTGGTFSLFSILQEFPTHEIFIIIEHYFKIKATIDFTFHMSKKVKMPWWGITCILVQLLITNQNWLKQQCKSRH